MTTDRQQESTSAATRLAQLTIVFCCVTIIVGHFTRVDRFTDLGLAMPPEFLTICYSVFRFVASLASSVALGAVVFSVVNTRDGKKLHPVSYLCQSVAEKSLALWAVSSVFMIPLCIVHSTGSTISAALTIQGLESVLDSHEELTAWIVSALVAAIVYVILKLTISWQVHVWMISPLSIASLAVMMTGNANQGRNHDLATGAQIIAMLALNISVGFVFLYFLHKNFSTGFDSDQITRRTSLWVRCSMVLFVIHAVILMLIFLPTPDIFGTTFGIITLVIIGLGLVTMIFPLQLFSLMGMLALIHIIDTWQAPGLLKQGSSIWNIMLGYELPGPPTIMRYLFHWRYDIVLGHLCIFLTIGYLIGVYILRKREIEWHPGRTVSWLAGMFITFWFTATGINAYGNAQFSVHMSVHMAINMFSPVLLVLGAPITLIMRVFPARPSKTLPGVRELVLGIVHSRFSGIITSPIASIAIFVASLYGLYFTPVFDLLVRYHWGHVFMNLHFLITGYLFYWSIIGIDPGPQRPQFLGRLGIVFAVMPFHAFFGVTTMLMRNQLIGGAFYHQLGLPWITDFFSDQATAGAIAWGTSEIPTVLIIASLIRQWFKQDERESKRKDRSAQLYDDSEYEEYNKMLKDLAGGH